MRRIVMFNRVTPEGCFAGPEGSLNWIVPDPELDRVAAESIGRSEIDTILFGRRTYQQFESFWPHVAADGPDAPNPHDDKRRSPELRAMATMLNEANKLVFSRTLKTVTWQNSRLFETLDPRVIVALKSAPGKDMIVFGSGSVVSQLTEHGLIDEYQFVVTPILLGRGRALFNGMSNGSKLALQEAKAFPTGNVMLRYARAA